MTNAKEELQDKLKKAGTTIKCALLRDVRSYDEKEQREFTLPVGHSKEQLTAFLSALNYNYDSGYGGQELEGIVWLNDGTWLDRGEYDGSEWWQHQKLPEIPSNLLQ